METRIFVGRANELDNVDRLVRDSEYDRRIAIVYAAEEMGKTALLDEIWDRYHKNTDVVFIDVGKEYEISSLVYDIAGQLAGCQVQLPPFPGPTVTLDHVDATNSPIDIAIDNTVSAWQEADRLLRELLAWINNSPSQLRRLVLIDEYEKAEAPLRRWLNTSLIPGLLSLTTTICVLAGRHEPSLTIAERERADRLPLSPLSPTDIDRWLDAVGITHTSESAIVIWRGTRGVPGSVSRFIINMSESEGGEYDS